MEEETECPDCQTPAVERSCHQCGWTETVIDCGHYAQPAPIAGGRVDGSDGDHNYCDDCAQIVEISFEDIERGIAPGLYLSKRLNPPSGDDCAAIEIWEEDGEAWGGWRHLDGSASEDKHGVASRFPLASLLEE